LIIIIITLIFLYYKNNMVILYMINSIIILSLLVDTHLNLLMIVKLIKIFISIINLLQIIIHSI